MNVTVSIRSTSYGLSIESVAGEWKCWVNGSEVSVDVAQVTSNRLSILIGGKSYDAIRGSAGTIRVGEHEYEVSVSDPRSWRSRQQTLSGTSGPQKLTASMPGKVVRVLASAGEKIVEGQGLVVVEAMKMQNEIRSPREGTVRAVLVREGSNVNTGEVVAIVE
jgi:biotin carboxyl carrier protein